MRAHIDNANRELLKSLPWPNVSCDRWSDGSVRSWNDYYEQGIADAWEMHNIPVAFNPVTGRHTGVNIKKKYDEVCEQFGISDRVFKIVADQAKNVKTAFKDT